MPYIGWCEARMNHETSEYWLKIINSANLTWTELPAQIAHSKCLIALSLYQLFTNSCREEPIRPKLMLLNNRNSIIVNNQYFLPTVSFVEIVAASLHRMSKPILSLDGKEFTVFLGHCNFYDKRRIIQNV
jgi:hypothetical protein